MRSARMRLAGAVVTVPLLLLATSCEFGSDDKKTDKVDHASGESTPPTKTAPAEPTASAPSSAAPGSKAPAGRTLTAEQLKAALITQRELPSGWTVAPGTPRTTKTATTEPAGCQPLMDLIAGDLKVKPVAEADAVLKNPKFRDATYRVEIRQFADAAAARKVFGDAAAAAEPAGAVDCLRYSVKDAKGAKVIYEPGRYEKTPALGEKQLWLSASFGDEKTMNDTTAGSDALSGQYVLSGSVIVTIFGSGPQGAYPRVLEDGENVVKPVVDKVLAAQKG
jgi:hypothetical protein